MNAIVQLVLNGVAALAFVFAVPVIGDSVGYTLGRRYGRRLLGHTAHRLVTPERLDRGSSAINPLGGRAVLVGRFTAVLRALVPSLARTAAMPYRTFAVYNIAGAMLWATGFVLLGYAAGQAFRTAEHIARPARLVLLGAIVVGATAALLVRRRRRARQPTAPPQGPGSLRGARTARSGLDRWRTISAGGLGKSGPVACPLWASMLPRARDLPLALLAGADRAAALAPEDSKLRGAA
jgi:membrane protein DedA with SNARE-associated domain